MEHDLRFILFHKQSSSARTRFLLLPGGLLAFAPAPSGSSLIQEGRERGNVRLHPATALRYALQHFGLENGALQIVPDFYAELETSRGVLPVLLAGFTSIDPPIALADSYSGRFIALTEARGLPPLELELARRAYEILIG